MPALHPSVRHVPLFESDDWFGPDQHLAWLGRRTLGEETWAVAGPALAEAGRLVPTVVEPLVRRSERELPVLRQYDARGARVDDIDLGPAFVELEAIARRFGLVGMAYTDGWRGLRGRAPHVLVALAQYMFTQSDVTVTSCPVGMAWAMCRALERNDRELASRFVPRIASMDGDWMTSAMYLTEKAGGSDVGAGEAKAVRAGDGSWRLHGEKWFCSNVTADLALVLARPLGAGPGSRGLGLFLMPRQKPDGTRNDFLVLRLKDKLGTRPMPSGELLLEGAFAWQVGEVELGIKQMMDMVNLTRVGLSATSAGVMRRAAYESLEHARRRVTFGQPLVAHPGMADVLADLVADATAGLTGAVAVADALQRADAGEPRASGVLRMLTPMLKAHLTVRLRPVVTEALDVRGGNGYIEDWPEPRLLRDGMVYGIWEGPANIMALDVLRALAHGAGPHLLEELESLAEAASAGITEPIGRLLLVRSRALAADLVELAGLDLDAQQLRARRLMESTAQLTIATHLAEQAHAYADDTGSGRLAWIAARYAARLGGPAALAAVAGDPGWLRWAEPILHGGHVPLEVGAEACAATASALA